MIRVARVCGSSNVAERRARASDRGPSSRRSLGIAGHTARDPAATCRAGAARAGSAAACSASIAIASRGARESPSSASSDANRHDGCAERAREPLRAAPGTRSEIRLLDEAERPREASSGAACERAEQIVGVRVELLLRRGLEPGVAVSCRELQRDQRAARIAVGLSQSPYTSYAASCRDRRDRRLERRLARIERDRLDSRRRACRRPPSSSCAAACSAVRNVRTVRRAVRRRSVSCLPAEHDLPDLAAEHVATHQPAAVWRVWYAPREREQLRVRALLDDLAVLHHEDEIGVADRREPVRDHEARAALAQRRHRALDQHFGARVDRRRRLVEDQDRRIREERARDRDQLLLAGADRFELSSSITVS